MKKNIRMILAATLLLMCGNVLATDVTLPAGTYYFDFTAVTGTVGQVQVFNDAGNGKRYNTSTAYSTSDITFESSNPLNTGLSQSNYKTYYKSGDIEYLVVSIAYGITIGDNYNFLCYNDGSDHWWSYSATSIRDLGTNQYVCVVTSSGYAWQTSGTLPSTTPSLTIAAGANGSLGECTAGETTISGTTEIEAGTSVHLIADADDDYSFYGWVRADGSVASTLADYVFSMPSSSLSLTATFYADNTDPSISGCEGCFKIKP